MSMLLHPHPSKTKILNLGCLTLRIRNDRLTSYSMPTCQLSLPIQHLFSDTRITTYYVIGCLGIRILISHFPMPSKQASRHQLPLSVFWPLWRKDKPIMVVWMLLYWDEDKVLVRHQIIMIMIDQLIWPIKWRFAQTLSLLICILHKYNNHLPCFQVACLSQNWNAKQHITWL